MNHLIADMCRFGLAPTVRRELAAAVANVVLVAALVLLVLDGWLPLLVGTAAVAVYGAVRVALVARRVTAGSAATPPATADRHQAARR